MDGDPEKAKEASEKAYAAITNAQKLEMTEQPCLEPLSGTYGTRDPTGYLLQKTESFSVCVLGAPVHTPP